jgi:hypothetical protein
LEVTGTANGKKDIQGLEKWDIDPQQLADAQVVGVSVRFDHPLLEEVTAFPDLKDRVRFARQYYR